MPTVYDQALQHASPLFPFKSIALIGCAPVGFFLLRVMYVLSNVPQDPHSPNSSANNALLELRNVLLLSLILSVCGYYLTATVVPKIAARLLTHVPGLSGVDIGKRGLKGPQDGQPVAESLGIVPGTVFLIVLTLTATFARVGGVELSERFQQSDFNVAIGSITMAVLLGLVDDLVDLKWREKLVVGAVMALPLVGSYSGPTSVILPRQLRFLIAVDPLQEHVELTSFGNVLEHFVSIDRHAHGSLIDLGPWYLVFMFALVIFCTNAINIYAGINGIEAGQTYVTGCGIAVMNLLELLWRGPEGLLEGDGMNHAFSLLIMLPFIGTLLGYLNHNWYPAKVFGGDVLPYYSGMTLAVSAMMGHFPKSLFLLMLPQLMNFVYSLPQLFKWVPIPRHRLPRVNVKTGFLRPSKVAPNDDRNNMTLLCLAIKWCGGELHERTLCGILLVFQGVCCILGLYLRYGLGALMYGWINVFDHRPSGVDL